MKHFSRLLIAALLFQALPGRAASLPDCSKCNASSAYFDKGSGLCLPQAVEGLESVEQSPARQAAMRAYRNTLVTGFNLPVHRLAITTYLYDRDDSPADVDTRELHNTVAEILQAHPGATREKTAESLLPVGGAAAPGVVGFFLWEEGGNDHASFLWLIPRGQRYLKIRATYIRPHGGEGAPMRDVLGAVRRVADNFCRARPLQHE